MIFVESTFQNRVQQQVHMFIAIFLNESSDDSQSEISQIFIIIGNAHQNVIQSGWNVLLKLHFHNLGEKEESTSIPFSNRLALMLSRLQQEGKVFLEFFNSNIEKHFRKTLGSATPLDPRGLLIIQ